MPPPESADREGDAAEFIDIGRMDWFVSKSWNRLHAVLEFTDDHKADMEQEWGVSSPVRLACGRTAAGVWIPGMFTRMGAQRCKGCCRTTGMPPGKGSPKNDDACRVLLGLPAGGGGLCEVLGDEERSEEGENRVPAE
jgi:hypothetical protein